MGETGFKFLYGYTQSDEISLLFDPLDRTFDRKERKLLSVLAGEASGKMSILLHRAVSMDCRLLELGVDSDVLDYFMWRQADAKKNGLSSYVYWALREANHSPAKAYRRMNGLKKIDLAGLLKETNGVDWHDDAAIPNGKKTASVYAAESTRRKATIQSPAKACWLSEGSFP